MCVSVEEERECIGYHQQRRHAGVSLCTVALVHVKSPDSRAVMGKSKHGGTRGGRRLLSPGTWNSRE